MGIDIYSDGGILFELDEAVNKFFKGLNKKTISEVIEDCLPILAEEDDIHFLKSVENLDDLKSWFIGLAQKSLDDNKYLDEEFLIIVWNKIINKTKFNDLPQVRFKYFTSNRYSGYEVPIDTICLVFNDDDLFEVKMTAKGRAVAKKMGYKEIKKTSWTVYSY